MNSNNKFEIIVDINGTSYYLDTYDVVPVPLNYQISDINDIASRKASSSLSITVPETANNRYIFNSISDLSVDLTYFDPNRKAPVKLLVDSIVVFTGSLQLTNVDVDLYTHETKYTTVVYSHSDTFFKSLGDDMLGGYPTLSSLDFKELDHLWSTASITGSWTQSWGYGYFYPLIDTTGEWSMARINGSPTGSGGGGMGTQVGTVSSVKITDFYPATYVKYIWKKIFDSVGFKWKSNFLDNSDVFNNLLLPFSQNVLNQSLSYASTLQFVADVSTFSVLSGSYSLVRYPNPNYIDLGGTGNYFHKIIPFNRDVTDPYNFWNTSTYTYTRGTQSGQFKQRFGFSANRIYYDYITNASQGREFIAIMGVRSKFPTGYQGRTPGSNVPGWSATPTIQQLFLYPRIPFPGGNNFAIVKNNGYQGYPNWITRIDGYGTSGSTQSKPYVQFDMWTDYLDSGNTSNSRPPNNLYYEPLYPGEEVRFFAIHFTTDLPNVSGNPNTPNMYYGENSRIKNDIDPQLIPNQGLSYNSVLPSNLKQKDFITSIIKMFNLYIEPSKEDPNTLIIEPRDDYYDSGEFKDWSSKLDTSIPIKQQILAETQNRGTLFTYKKDTDFWNIDYSDKLKRQYGDVRYTLDNDFIDGEKKIDTVFSPTPLQLLSGSNGIVLPIIFKKNNGKQLQKADSFNFRILRKATSGLVQLVASDRWTFENGSYTSYPYVGHFNDPYTPTEDINWGQSYLYYQNEPTNNNLFNTYWKSTMDELYNINSRVVTANFYLTPEDIANFRFNDNIYVVIDGVGGYYKVNKISNYDPTDIRSTQVELLKTINITVPNNLTTNQPDTEEILLPGTANITGYINTIATSMRSNTNTGGGLAFINGINNGVGGNYTTTQGTYNTNNADSSFISGCGNIINNGRLKVVSGDYNFDNTISRSTIFGSNNTLYGFGTDNLVVGNFNTASGTNSVIIGSGNNLGTFSGVVVIGNGLSASQDNTTYINNTTIVLGGSSSTVIISGSVSQDNIKVGVNEIAYGTGVGITSSNNFTFDKSKNNLLVGLSQSITGSSQSVIIGGFSNILNGNYSIISGGRFNNISQPGGSGGYVFLGGGQCNVITGGYGSSMLSGFCNSMIDSDNSSIVGGDFNTINGVESSIVGGKCGFINSVKSSIVGGYLNCVSASRSSIIIGGEHNTVAGGSCGYQSYRNSISGGLYNSIVGDYIFDNIISGGINNIIMTQSYSSIINGGDFNTIKSTQKSSILGGFQNQINTSCQSAIIGGYQNQIGTSSNSSIIGGKNNNINISNYSSIVGGFGNLSSQTYYSFIGGALNSCVFGYSKSSILSGNQNQINGSVYSSIIGGQSNKNTLSGGSIILGSLYNKIYTSSYSSTIGGKYNSMTQSVSSIISGGYNSINISYASSILGGTGSSINNSYNSSIIGGYQNQIGTSSNSGIFGGVSNILNGCKSYNNLITGGCCNMIGLASYSYSYNNLIVGGCCNTLSSGNYGFIYNSSIIGGFCNTSGRCNSSIIGGACNNTGVGKYSSIVGGRRNSITDNFYSVGIINGDNNTISGFLRSSNFSVIIGGNNNTLTGVSASVILGSSNKTLDLSINSKNNNTLVTNFILTGSMSTINGSTYSVGWNGTASFGSQVGTFVNGILINIV